MSVVMSMDNREQMVVELEKWIERAKKGEVNALGIAGQVEGTNVATTFILGGPRSNLWTLAGAIEELRYRLFNEGASYADDV